MSEYTEDKIIFAYQQIGLGRDAADVYMELVPDAEYPELGAITLLGSVRSWYKKQTPQRLKELLCDMDTDLPPHRSHDG